MKKTYKAPKVVCANEKIYPAVLNGLIWFALRAIFKANTSFENTAPAEVKTLQSSR